MIVERLDHAANRVLHQLVVVDRVDIILPHALQHFGQQARVAATAAPRSGPQAPGRADESSTGRSVGQHSAGHRQGDAEQ